VIVQAPDPALLQVCRKVDLPAGLAEARDVAEDLRREMRESERRAAGLAAPQIGSDLRIFCLAGHAHAFINPTIIRASRERMTQVEGCLSLPEHVRIKVERPIAVQIQAWTERGSKRILTLDGSKARAFQHELDHLNGILIINYDPRVAAARDGCRTCHRPWDECEC